MSTFFGSFLGFTFDGVHSSELGIVRTSTSDRYTENLTPEMQDNIVQVPNGDGSYYFGSYYTRQTFQIPFAFDDLSESQLLQLKNIFGKRGLHKLIFDETPYKYYLVSVTGVPNLRYVVFDKDPDEQPTSIHRKSDLYNGVDPDWYEGAFQTKKSNRVYKGEGTLTCTCFTPYAKSTKKFKDQFVAHDLIDHDGYENYQLGADSSDFYEWIDSVRYIDSDYTKTYMRQGVDITYTIDQPQSTGCLIYNPGMLPTPFLFKMQGGVQSIVTNNNLNLGYCQIYGQHLYFYLQAMKSVLQNADNSYQSCAIRWQVGNELKTIYQGNIIDLIRMPVFLSPELEEESGNYTGTFKVDLYEADESTANWASPDAYTELIQVTSNSSAMIQIPTLTLYLNSTTFLQMDSYTLDPGDSGVQINSKLHLIEGINAEGKPTGRVYNNAIIAGNFFEIPTTDIPILMNITIGDNTTLNSIEYDYIFF